MTKQEEAEVFSALVKFSQNLELPEALYEVLKEHVKQKIGPWKYPRWIDVVESLPKTATGKIQRYKLRDGEAAKH